MGGALRKSQRTDSRPAGGARKGGREGCAPPAPAGWPSSGCAFGGSGRCAWDVRTVTGSFTVCYRMCSGSGIPKLPPQYLAGVYCCKHLFTTVNMFHVKHLQL